MTTYCAPCLADLALAREAVTAVAGTASCMAHAVLLTHPSDTPQRRLTRLTELRAQAEGKLATASVAEVPELELLVQEYALAGAMDMTVPLRDLAGDRTPRPAKSRRNRPGRGERPEGEAREQREPRAPRERRPQQGEAASTNGNAPATSAAPTGGDATPESAAPSETSAPSDSKAPAESSAPAENAAPAEPSAPTESSPAPVEHAAPSASSTRAESSVPAETSPAPSVEAPALD